MRELPQPDLDRLSTLAALVLLTYGAIRIVELPTLAAQINVVGVIVPLQIDSRTVMLTLAAALAVVGSGWLLETHPSDDGQAQVERWVLPGMTALALGALIAAVPIGLWLGLGLGATALLLTAVFYAEFVVLDAEDPRREFAAAGLEALGYFLVLQSAFFLRASGFRAVFLVPALLIGGTVIGLRLLRLRGHSSPLAFGLGIGWLLAQVGWTLRYLPLLPLQGSMVLVLLFALSLNLASEVQRTTVSRRRLITYFAIALGGAVVAMLFT